MRKRGVVGVKASNNGQREREGELLLEQAKGTAKFHIFVKLLVSLKQCNVVLSKHIKHLIFLMIYLM